MPSPFPGMDPYLEAPSWWPTFHSTFIIYLQEHLQSRLPDQYAAAAEERAYIEVPEEELRVRQVIPDVTVRTNDPFASGGTAVITEPLAAEPLVIPLNEIEVKERYLNIYDVRHPQERLVATIELLSPSNKMERHLGREEYLQKQAEVLKCGVHLVEIDLLRDGKHTTAVPLALLRNYAGAVPYHVCLRAFDQPHRAQVFPIGLRQRLPVIGIPLLPGDGFVNADLQAVFDRAYDAGPFRKRVRYGAESLIPPLSQDDAAWADECIRSKVVR
jgi:hypothetical protein